LQQVILFFVEMIIFVG